MKRLAITIIILLSMGLGAFAQGGGGLLGRGDGQYEYGTDWGTANWNTTMEWVRNSGLLGLPLGHSGTDDYDTPLGTGIAVLAALGGTYLVGKKRKD